jgi:sarcosine oxidase
VERVVQAWWPVARPADFGPDRFPVFIHHTGGGVACYGVPSTDGATIKVAGHGGGSPADPDRLDREPRPADWERNAAFVRERLRGVEAEPALARVCMYANTPDEHFLIAPLPDAPEIVVVSACSGHGFKFMPVLGEVAVQLALDGSTRFDLGPFGFREAARLG